MAFGDETLGTVLIELRAQMEDLTRDLDKARDKAESTFDGIAPGELSVNANVDDALTDVQRVEEAALGLPDGDTAISAEGDQALAEVQMVADSVVGIPDGTTAIMAEASDALAGAEQVRLALDIPDEVVALKVDNSDALAGTQEIRSAFAGLGAGIAGIAGAAAIKDLTLDAATLNDTINGTNVVFRDAAGTIQSFAVNSADTLGMSQQATLEYSNQLGTLLQGLGYTAADASSLTIDALNRANDVSSATGIERQRVVEAMISAYAGERESIKSIIGAISEEDVARKALTMGLGQSAVETEKVEAARIRLAKAEAKLTELRKSGTASALEIREAENGVATAAAAVEKALAGGTVELSAQEKAAATHALIMEKSARFQGDFNKTQDEGLNSLARTSSAFENLQAKVGQAYVSEMETIQPFLQSMIVWVAELPAPLHAVIGAGGMLVGTIGSLATAIGPLVLGLGLTGAAGGTAAGGLGAAAAGLWALMAPILAVVAVIAVIGVAIWALITHWDTLKVVAGVVWDWIWGKVSWVASALVGLFQNFTLPGLIIKHWDTIKGAIGGAADWVVDKWNGLLGWFAGIPAWFSNTFSMVGDAILGPFRWAIDGIRSLWNSTIGGFGFDIPSWVPGIGGNSMTIPYLAEGGRIEQSGFAVVGEKGPEVLWLNRGEVVSPIGDGGSAGGGANAGATVVVNNYAPVGGIRDFANALEGIMAERGYGRGRRR